MFFVNVQGLKNELNPKVLKWVVGDYDVIVFTETTTKFFQKSYFEKFDVLTGTNEI